MPENQLSIFIQVIISLVKVMDSIRDQFYSQKLHSHIGDCMEEFLQQAPYVAQSMAVGKLTSRIDLILELLDHYEYGHIAAGTPLSLARKNLLNFKLLLLASGQTKPSVPKHSAQVPVVSVSPRVTNSKFRSDRHTSDKSEILAYIIKHNQVRPRDIQEAFKKSSKRTIQRTISQLLQDKQISQIGTGKSRLYRGS